MRRFASLPLLLFAACTVPEASDAGSGSGPLFLAQSQAQTEVMQALFTGRVIADSAGCLRLHGPDNATVVWPEGFTLAADSSVVDPTGVGIGRLGGDFRLGGGEVDSIPLVHLAGSEDSRAVQARCPGKFWIAADVGSHRP